MYFDEGTQLNHSRNSKSATSSRIGFARQEPGNSTCENTNEGRPVMVNAPRQSTADWKTGGALNAANNKLQELMQLFYLLSRDPAIPQDARYHVTVAQSEIALLTRLMQNVANNSVGENQPLSAANL